MTDIGGKPATELISQQEEASPDLGLRVFVYPGGCSGMSYGMAFEDQPADDDLTIKVRASSSMWTRRAHSMSAAPRLTMKIASWAAASAFSTRMLFAAAVAATRSTQAPTATLLAVAAATNLTTDDRPLAARHPRGAPALQS